MRGQMHKVAELATGQLGLVTRSQLLELGVGADAIAWQLRTGRLHARHPRVYAVGHMALSRRAEWLAAVWTCGEGAVLSHGTAAAVHGMAPETGRDVHVSTLRPVRSRPGIVVHRTRHLGPADVVTLGLLPVTRQPRTLVDLADLFPYAELREVADGLRRLDLAALAAAQRRAPNRRGAARVARLVASDQRRTRSEFERRYLRFCTAHGVPRPEVTNAKVGHHEVDALYAGARLAVELDGRAHHERRAQMRDDRRRDADLQLAGFRVLRLVWEQLDRDEAAATAGLVRALLSA